MRAEAVAACFVGDFFHQRVGELAEDEVDLVDGDRLRAARAVAVGVDPFESPGAARQ